MKKLKNLVIIALVVLFVGSAVALVAASAEEHREAAEKIDLISSTEVEDIRYEVDVDDIYFFIHGFHVEEAMEYEIKDGEIVISPSEEKFMVKFDHETNLVSFMSSTDIKDNIILKPSTVVYLVSIIFLSMFLIGFVIMFLIEEHYDNKALDERIARAKAAEEARTTSTSREAVLEAEAEAIIAEAVEALAIIKDNDLVVFNSYSLEYELNNCCFCVCRSTIDKLKEALDNLVYRD